MKARRLKILVVLVGMASLLLVACGAQSSGSSGTLLLRYSPYGQQREVSPSVTVTQSVSGKCISPGSAGGSSYFCVGEPSGVVEDPRFARPKATSGPLLCEYNPLTSDVVRFEVSTLPARSHDVTETRPWAIQLSNGQPCKLVQGAGGVGGTFQCSVTQGSSSYCHAPKEGSPWWTASCQDDQSSSGAFVRYRVTKVWT
jgi:hypothetical protein